MMLPDDDVMKSMQEAYEEHRECIGKSFGHCMRMAFSTPQATAWLREMRNAAREEAAVRMEQLYKAFDPPRHNLMYDAQECADEIRSLGAIMTKPKFEADGMSNKLLSLGLKKAALILHALALRLEDQGAAKEAMALVHVVSAAAKRFDGGKS